MKTVFGFLLSASLLLWAGCGGDDDGGTEPGPTETVVTAVTAATAPSMSNVSDAVWSQATAVSIGVTSGSATPKSRANAALTVASQLSLQALVYSDTLYLRAIWSDATFDCWPGLWVVDSMAGTSPEFEHIVDRDQDRMLVLFKGLPNNIWDVWYWKVHSTAVEGVVGGTITGFAEGYRLSGTQLLTDAGSLALVRANENYGGAFNRPTFLHEDTMLFTGFILPLAHADSLGEGEFPQSGWSLEDTIPGYLTDQSLATETVGNLNSRWDVRGVWRHSSGQYTVVLKGALDTGHDDDLEMTSGERVPMKIILTNSATPSFLSGNADQGVTGLFYLQLP